MGDTAIAARSETEHLVFERVRGKGPAMAEDNGLSGAPILVIDLSAIFGGDRAQISLMTFFRSSCWMSSARSSAQALDYPRLDDRVPAVLTSSTFGSVPFLGKKPDDF